MSEVVGLTLTKHFNVNHLVTEFVLTYSLEGQPPGKLAISLTDEALVGNSEADCLILLLNAFGAALTSNGVSHEVSHKILKWIHIALKNSYTNPNQWSTATGTHPSAVSYATSPFTSGRINGKSVSTLSFKLPGINSKVDLPCDCGQAAPWTLRDAIMHLNDSCEWTRERIADWIDELHDKKIINAEFSVPVSSEEKGLAGWEDVGYTTEYGIYADAEPQE